MKRWIHASTSNSSVFDLRSTGTSYYDDFLTDEGLEYMQQHKNLTGHIDMISPQEYFDLCAEFAFGLRVNSEDLKRQREYSKFKDGTRFVDKYAQDMQNGDTFPLCYINYAEPGQEGLHRMYAAGEVFGWDTKFPVLIVEPYNQELWEEQELNQEMRRYLKYSFDDVVKQAEDAISDWNSPPPEDLAAQFRDAIIRCARSHEDGPHRIDVYISVDDDEIHIYLSEYEGHSVNIQEPPDQTRYVSDMFKVSGSDVDVDEYIDDLDTDDLDVESFFFE